MVLCVLETYVIYQLRYFSLGIERQVTDKPVDVERFSDEISLHKYTKLSSQYFQRPTE